jgi:hypothetical protein
LQRWIDAFGLSHSDRAQATVEDSKEVLFGLLDGLL